MANIGNLNAKHRYKEDSINSEDKAGTIHDM